MGHPMHLHGHKFWFLGTGTGTFPYATAQEAPKSLINLQNPPYRDTVELPSSGWAVIRYAHENDCFRLRSTANRTDILLTTQALG